MVLVEHDVEAQLIGEHPFVVVAMQQIGRDLGIAFAVRQIDAQRAAVVRPCFRVRLLGELVAGYLRSSSIVHVPFRNPPGFLTVEDNARMLRGQSAPRSYAKDGRVVDMHHGSVQDLIDAGILFCGTPDQVYAQIVDFTEYCGGMGNLLMMGHAGFLTHEDTMSNLELFSKHVMPRLKAYKQPVPEATAA